MNATAHHTDFLPDDTTARRHHELCCPHCHVQGLRRSSREITTTFREIYYVCRVPGCGHSWKASLTYTHGLSPSAIPDPAIDLPLRPMERGDVIRALADARAPGPDPNQPGLFDT